MILTLLENVLYVQKDKQQLRKGAQTDQIAKVTRKILIYTFSIMMISTTNMKNKAKHIISASQEFVVDLQSMSRWYINKFIYVWPDNK